MLSYITIIFTIHLATSLQSYASTFPFEDCDEIFGDLPFADCGGEDNSKEDTISNIEDISPDDIFAVPFP